MLLVQKKLNILGVDILGVNIPGIHIKYSSMIL